MGWRIFGVIVGWWGVSKVAVTQLILRRLARLIEGMVMAAVGYTAK
jgi:hypothetical protein